MTEMRLHGVALHAGPPEFRIHGISLTASQVEVPNEFRIHAMALTSSTVPPISDGGWWVRINGEWVEHEAFYWDGTQWV